MRGWKEVSVPHLRANYSDCLGGADRRWRRRADFDANLAWSVDGPTHAGDKILLGGMQDITIWKSLACPIVLQNETVADAQCKLVRVDFADRVGNWWPVQMARACLSMASALLTQPASGDTIDIGQIRTEIQRDEEDWFRRGVSDVASGHQAAPVPPKPEQPTSALERHPLPKLREAAGINVKFCMDCGINVKTGRPDPDQPGS